MNTTMSLSISAGNRMVSIGACIDRPDRRHVGLPRVRRYPVLARDKATIRACAKKSTVLEPLEESG